MAKPRLLVTRFAPHAQQVANLLNEQGIFCHAQPLLEVKANTNSVYPFYRLFRTLQHNSLVIKPVCVKCM